MIPDGRAAQAVNLGGAAKRRRAGAAFDANVVFRTARKCRTGLLHGGVSQKSALAIPQMRADFEPYTVTVSAASLKSAIWSKFV